MKRNFSFPTLIMCTNIVLFEHLQSYIFIWKRAGEWVGERDKEIKHRNEIMKAGNEKWYNRKFPIKIKSLLLQLCLYTHSSYHHHHHQHLSGNCRNINAKRYDIKHHSFIGISGNCSNTQQNREKNDENEMRVMREKLWDW
jgi:hypothetical protein